MFSPTPATLLRWARLYFITGVAIGVGVVLLTVNVFRNVRD